MNEPTSKPSRVEYAAFVAALCKPGEEIRSTLSARDCHLLHMAVGVAGEAGELLDAVKKAAIYRKPLDVSNVIEELGDLEFFMEGIRGVLGIAREDVLEANRAKLSERYKKLAYSDAAAQERADKEEGAPRSQFKRFKAPEPLRGPASPAPIRGDSAILRACAEKLGATHVCESCGCLWKFTGAARTRTLAAGEPGPCCSGSDPTAIFRELVARSEVKAPADSPTKAGGAPVCKVCGADWFSCPHVERPAEARN